MSGFTPFVPSAGGGPPSGPAGGDLSGTYPDPQLALVGGAATAGDYVRGNGTKVALSTIQAGDVPTLNQNTTGTAAGLTGFAATQNSKVAGPLTVNSASALLMYGCDVTFMPASTGKVLVVAHVACSTITASTNFTIGARYGTGAPPSNLAAVTGTRFGSSTDKLSKASSINTTYDYVFVDVLESLVVGTAYWFDFCGQLATTGDDTTIQDVSLNFFELPY